MSWRDAAVPGHGSIPAGAPLAGPGTPKPAALNTYLQGAVRHEQAGTTTLSMRVRTALWITAVLDLVCAIGLIAWVRPAKLGLIGDIVSWGGHWELVGVISAAAGVALLVLATLSDWFAHLTNHHLYGVWAAVAASAVTTGLAVAVAALAAALFVIACIVGAMCLIGMMWAVISSD